MRARASRALPTALLAGALVTILAAGCASRPPAFGPASLDDSRRALEIWHGIIERADSQGAVRLLYDARLSEGLVKVPGTLAVEARPDHLEATLTGPFGSPVARYTSGVLEAKGARPIALDPQELLAVLAGVWRSPVAIAGTRRGETLLRFTGRDQVEAILDVPGERLASLTIARPEALLVATYSGRLDPWPEKISIEDRRSGKRLDLALVAKEPAGDRPGSP